MPKLKEETRKIWEEKKKNRKEVLDAYKNATKIDKEIRDEKFLKIERDYKERMDLKEKSKKESRIIDNCDIHAIQIINACEMKVHTASFYAEYKKIINSYDKIRYFENSDSVSYVNFIKEKVESVFGNNITKVDNNKHFDFILRYRNMKFKVKHIISSYQNPSSWFYYIKYNKVADAFLLTAIDNKKLMNFQHLWFIQTQEMFETKRLGKKLCRSRFYNRYSLRIYLKKDIIEYMSRFELKDELDKLKRSKSCAMHNEHKSMTNMLLLEKQEEIFNNTGKKRSIGYLIEKAIEMGREKLGTEYDSEDNINNTVQRMLKKKLREKEGIRLELLPEEYENEAYNLVIEKQRELLNLTGELKSLKEVIEECIESGIYYIME